jgi:hypothetical protein
MPGAASGRRIRDKKGGRLRETPPFLNSTRWFGGYFRMCFMKIASVF